MPRKPLTQARVQRLAADPGERSKLSTSVLQKYGFGDLVRKRLLQQRLDSPVVPGSQMTQRDLAHQAGALTSVQYGAPIQLVQRQAQTAPDYYALYAKALRDSAATAQQQGVQSGQAIQGLYGSGPNAPNSPQSTVGQAQAGTAQLLGDTGRNFLNAMAAAAIGQGVQQRNLALQKEADLKREAGAFNVAQRGQISRQEAQNVATNLVAGGNLALGQGRLAVQQQNADTSASRAKTAAGTAKTSQTTRDATFAATHEGYTPTQFAALPPAKQLAVIKRVAAATRAPKTPGKGPKPPKPTTGLGSLPPAQETKYVSQANQVASILRHPPKTKDGKTATRAQIIADIRAGTSPLGRGVDPRVINVGMSLADNQGAIGPWGVHNAHNLGIHVNNRWKVVKKPRGGAGLGTITDAIGNVVNP